MPEAHRIRQLEQLLAECDGNTLQTNPYKRIDLLSELAWWLSDTDMKRAYTLALIQAVIRPKLSLVRPVMLCSSPYEIMWEESGNGTIGEQTW